MSVIEFYCDNHIINKNILLLWVRIMTAYFKKLLSIILSLVMILTLTAGFDITAYAADSKIVAGEFNYDYAKKVLSLVNTERKKAGLEKLDMTKELLNSAMIRASEIYVSFDHIRPNGNSCFTAFDWQGTAGENIAAWQTSAQQVMESWMDSDGHKANILSPNFTKIGIGCFITNSGSCYWVQIFSAGEAVSYSKSGVASVKVNVSLSADRETVVKSSVSGHTVFSKNDKKATYNKNGKITNVCKYCGKTISKKAIPKASNIKLSAVSYTYNGKVRKPVVTVKDSKGKKISSKYYSVTYSKGRKNVGTYTVTIKFKGNYSGTVKKTFTIEPKPASISKLTAGKKKFTVKWKKQTSQTTGYQIQYSTSSKFKSAKTASVSKNKTTSKTISKLKAKKKYYVRIRTYKTVNGKKIYSFWSKVKTVTTKK